MGRWVPGQFFAGQFFAGQFFNWTILQFFAQFFSSKADNSSPDSSSLKIFLNKADCSSTGQFFTRTMLRPDNFSPEVRRS
jgi:hypothetical protein